MFWNSLCFYMHTLVSQSGCVNVKSNMDVHTLLVWCMLTAETTVHDTRAPINSNCQRRNVPKESGSIWLRAKEEDYNRRSPSVV